MQETYYWVPSWIFNSLEILAVVLAWLALVASRFKIVYQHPAVGNGVDY